MQGLDNQHEAWLQGQHPQRVEVELPGQPAQLVDLVVLLVILQPFLHPAVLLQLWGASHSVGLLVVILGFVGLALGQVCAQGCVLFLAYFLVEDEVELLTGDGGPHGQEGEDAEYLADAAHHEKAEFVVVDRVRSFLNFLRRREVDDGQTGQFHLLRQTVVVLEFPGMQGMGGALEVLLVQVPHLDVLVAQQRDQCQTAIWVPDEVADLAVTALQLD